MSTGSMYHGKWEAENSRKSKISLKEKLQALLITFGIRDIVTIQGQTNNTQSVPGVTDNWKTTFVEI